MKKHINISLTSLLIIIVVAWATPVFALPNLTPNRTASVKPIIRVDLGLAAPDFTVNVQLDVEKLPQEFSGKVYALVEIYSENKSLIAQGSSPVVLSNGNFKGITKVAFNLTDPADKSTRPNVYVVYIKLKAGDVQNYATDKVLASLGGRIEDTYNYK